MEYRLNKNTYKIHLLARIPFMLIMLALIGVAEFFLINKLDNAQFEYASILLIIINSILLIVILLVISYVFIQPYFLYKNARLTINKDYIEYTKGWIFYSTTFLPLTKVQQVDITTGPIQSKYKASSITINTAFDSLDTDSIDKQICDDLKQQILNKSLGELHEN